MARKRMIDPSIWTDEGMAALTPRQQLLYIGLVSNADDDGRLRGSAVAVGLMLPTVMGEATVAEVEADLRAVLGQMRKLCRYQHDGNTYLCFRNYARWQNINRPTTSRLPAPPDETVSDTHSDTPTHLPISDSSVMSRCQTRLREEKIEESRVEEVDREIASQPREATRPASGADAPRPLPRYSPEFEEFWKRYPPDGKTDKAGTYAEYKRQKPDQTRLMDGLTRWRASRKWAEGVIVDAKRWMKERRWDAQPEAAGTRQTTTRGRDRPGLMSTVSGALDILNGHHQEEKDDDIIDVQRVPHPIAGHLAPPRAH